ncbi:sugar MFS transporter [Ferrovum sp.]|uniref:sugar MFS transporter n=2 Tax=Ferrovum sp. TaxID=2609467 RepID=UPI00263677E1|nr:sugar MFS transporter [Ferrovum sp.]
MEAVVAVFFCWGMSTVLIDSLVPKLKVLFSLGYAEVLLTQFSFFIGYLVFSVPAGQILAWLGYARSIALGLAVALLGCLLFIPATEFREFPWFLGALFVLSAGITLLQVSVNPLVMELGDSALAHSRLTLAQAFNSLGTTLGPLIGAAVILRHATFEDMDPMRWPFLAIAVIFGALSLLFWKGRNSPNMPRLQESPSGVDWQLFKRPRFAFGWSTLFVYVGAEVTLGSLMTSYLIQPQVLSVSAPVAGSLVSLYWGGAMVGRFLGSWVLSRWPAPWVLGGCALGAATLVLISSLSQGHLAAGALISVGLCNSIMFPVIFSLTLEDLGGDTPKGSGLLCMAIVGGALIPLLTGTLADAWGLARAFGIPVLCYLIIASFAFLQKRMVR